MSEEKCTCGCEHDHEDEVEMEVITLTLDDDTELECAVIGVFDVDDVEYIALLPKDDETVLLYEYYEEEDGEIRLENIADDDVFEKVSAEFNALMDDMDEDEEE